MPPGHCLGALNAPVEIYKLPSLYAHTMPFTKKKMHWCLSEKNAPAEELFFSHSLYYEQLSIARYQLLPISFYANNYFDQIPILSSAFNTNVVDKTLNKFYFSCKYSVTSCVKGSGL